MRRLLTMLAGVLAILALMGVAAAPVYLPQVLPWFSFAEYLSKESLGNNPLVDRRLPSS